MISHAVAWSTRACGLTSVVFAPSAAVARQATFRSAREAGFDVRYIDVRAKRAPELDEAASDWPGKPRPIVPTLVCELLDTRRRRDTETP